VQITVKLFAVMAEQAGTRHVDLSLPTGAPLDKVPGALRRLHPQLQWPKGTLLAVNQHYAPAAQSLQEGDEVAVIPPVSGG
jgi:molybdopterin converting factor subunit 1